MLHWIATSSFLFWAILISSQFLLIITSTSSLEPKIDLLVHFTRYLARSHLKETIMTILENNNIHNEINPIGGIYEAKYTDFIKIRLHEKDHSHARQVLKELPDFKAFSLDRKVKWEPKNDVTNERMMPYDYKFLTNLTEELNLPHYWKQGIKGQGVKIAIFDTGISDVYKKSNHKNIKKVNNWSDEQYANGMDFNGHGTFVTSIITNSNKECPGIAPEADLFIFKVFTKNEETSYSWFLEAFNFCIEEKVDLISFSMGSTNFIEKAFVQKIKEVVENDITIIAAAGNDGPFFGTINHPADLNEVLAVGGIDAGGSMVAGYSSRGMTNSELAYGMGRVKPDIVTSSKFIISANTDGECDTKSGTSVAVPIITGSLALILSSLEPSERAKINPASIRQGLIETAKKLEEATMFEQGAGLFDLKKAFHYFKSQLKPKITIFPSSLNLADEETYTYPYSLQPIYFTGIPTILNLTIHNSLTKYSKISKIEWNSKSSFKNHMNITAQKSDEIYPYFGNIALIISLRSRLHVKLENNFNFEGNVRVYFDCEKCNKINDHFDVKLTLQLANTPPREKRILWDQFHNMKFPESGFIPRDSLTNLDYPYEWHGDHPYINFFHLFKVIQKRGYFLEILRGSFECFDANKYGILMIVDPEDKYSDREIAKLQEDVVYKGLSVILFAEWYDPHLMTLNTFEPKVKSHKNSPNIPTTPVTGGANVPALNTLLKDFGIALGSTSYAGDFKYANRTHSYLSGSYIIRFPKNGVLLTFDLYNESNVIIKRNFRSIQYEPKPILGLLKNIYNQPTSGRFIVYGDSNCIDSAYMTNNCFDLFRDMLQFVETGRMTILDHFHNAELPQNYVAKEEVVYFKDKDQPLIKNFSKHENPHLWDKSICCEKSYPAKRTIDFTELKILSEVGSASVDNWISKQKDKPLDIISAKDYTLMEYVQSVLMTFSVILIVFVIYLVRRRRKRSRYSPMERAKGQVIIV